jgi:hypothetical protein
MGYRYSFLKPDHAYFQAWQDLRRRTKVAWIATVALIPAVAIGILVVSPLSFALQSDVPAAVMSMLIMVGWIVLQYRNNRFLCPRCELLFFRTWWLYWMFTDKCRRCGLPKYAPCDPADQKWEFESRI